VSIYSVLQAQDDLDDLIDRALAGEEVFIAHGGGVVELRGLTPQDEPAASAEQT
jgi:antitoxin (DNA-binding transcriptional repressor) of toxin-antitoxin stability system